MTACTLEKTIYLKATPEKVWGYLTQPDLLAKWFHKPPTALEKGAYAMYGTESGDKLMWGDVTVADPFSRLEYSFTVGPMNGHVSHVKWALDEVPGGTRLRLVHENLPAGEEEFGLTLALDKGWDDHFARLRDGIHQEAA